MMQVLTESQLFESLKRGIARTIDAQESSW